MADPLAGIEFREEELPSAIEALKVLHQLEQAGKALFKIGLVVRAVQHAEQEMRQLTGRVQELRDEAGPLQAQIDLLRAQVGAAQDALDATQLERARAEEVARRSKTEAEISQTELHDAERGMLGANHARDAAERDRQAIVSGIKAKERELAELGAMLMAKQAEWGEAESAWNSRLEQAKARHDAFIREVTSGATR